MKLKFYQLDVFTDRPLGGNPLAVFPEGGDLTDEQMQALAREMNLSETTFVFPSDAATRKIRFFTPTSEIPLAGHPTIGTWWLLAELGLVDVPKQGDLRITQETGAGVLPVDLFFEDGRPVRVVMTQTAPEFSANVIDPDTLAKALGGSPGTVMSAPAPQVVSTALPQLMVPIATAKDLQELPSGGTGSELGALLRESNTDCAMCFHLDEGESKVRCRMFAPGLGVPEDPATGSAAGALGAYLVWHGIVRPHSGLASIQITQGVEIGRPSLIQVEVAVGNGGEITEVRVGGEAVTIIEGEVTI
jgi:trans-2,3-dihydro-3-hydroxyanthranilate isomerase